MTDELLTERRGDAWLLTINRPARRNAVTPELARRLADAVEEIGARDDARAVLITGAQGQFCAGLDLHWLAAHAAPGIREMQDALHRCQQAILAIVRCPLPVVALLHGLTAGFGLAFALACDLRIAAPSARFVPGYARLGLVPGGGITYALPRLIGMGRALRFLMGGGALDAAAACSIGLVDELSPGPDLQPMVDTLVRDFGRSPAGTLRTIKRLCRAADVGVFEQVLSTEGSYLLQSFQSEEFRRRLVAFTERSLGAPEPTALPESA